MTQSTYNEKKFKKEKESLQTNKSVFGVFHSLKNWTEPISST